MISAHVLDTTSGRPAEGIAVSLAVLEPNDTWRTIGSGTTNDDGRIAALANVSELRERTCRLRFETRAYFERAQMPVFFPFIEVAFVVDAARERYHVPLLLNPFGYSTYRGS
jgi:5-hydroxyisourate hydrolase